eukprot:Gb_36604 [translate_table: standard]
MKIRFNEALGRTTNNKDEFQALNRALKIALEQGLENLTIRGDSMLIIKIILGIYQPNDQMLMALAKDSLRMLQVVRHWEIQHIPRENNQEADTLAKQATMLNIGEIVTFRDMIDNTVGQILENKVEQLLACWEQLICSFMQVARYRVFIQDCLSSFSIFLCRAWRTHRRSVKSWPCPFNPGISSRNDLTKAERLSLKSPNPEVVFLEGSVIAILSQFQWAGTLLLRGRQLVTPVQRSEHLAWNSYFQEFQKNHFRKLLGRKIGLSEEPVFGGSFLEAPCSEDIVFGRSHFRRYAFGSSVFTKYCHQKICLRRCAFGRPVVCKISFSEDMLSEVRFQKLRGLWDSL